MTAAWKASKGWRLVLAFDAIIVVGALLAGEWLKALTFASIIAAVALIIAKERLIVELEVCNNDLAASNRELRRDLLTALRARRNP